jgi:acyl-CoA dehydrogenase
MPRNIVSRQEGYWRSWLGSGRAGRARVIRDFAQREKVVPEIKSVEHDVRSRARALAVALRPYELAVEEAAENVPPTLEREIVGVCVASGLFAPNLPRELGGAGLSLPEQVIVEEEIGGLTNWLWAALWRPPNVLVNASAEQVARYVRPYTRGEFRGCYAITEPGAGSDVSDLLTVARRVGDSWRISGDKWFVTGGDVARFLLVVAMAETDGDPAPTIFFVDRDAPGVHWGRQPKFSNHALYGHPEVTLADVRVGPADVLGTVGGGISLTHDWFREERLMIAARCVGAARRCLEEAHTWSRERQAFGQVIGDYQAMQWMLADSATELAAARALLYQTVDAIAGGLDPKIAHGQAAMVKLFASEMVGRVADRAVQIFGGRGYMREYAVERLWRDTRIDRIWEGTSEMQRLIVARALDRRGLDSLLDA